MAQVRVIINSLRVCDDTLDSGTAMVYDSLRIKTLLLTSHQDFPPIPDSADAFVATGTNARPTFFGCDPPQMPPDYPLVVYLPNSPPLNGSDPSTKCVFFHLLRRQEAETVRF
jgi:lysophospholipase